MEEIVKRRGRKKIVQEPAGVIPEQEEPIKKKRGRKKKWETTPFKNNYSTAGNEKMSFKHSENIDSKKYTTDALNFGNLCIKVHDNKDAEQDTSLDNYFVKKQDPECEIKLSSDEEDTCDIKKSSNRQLRHYINNEVSNIKLKSTSIRCFNCHHTFESPPFFLPFDYLSSLDRYKLFGNFCSPSCVKSYCMNNKTFENKVYLIGQFYRKLFGPNFRINPAPSILNLNAYGGKMSIEEFRKTFYTNSRYTMNNINCKVIYLE